MHQIKVAESDAEISECFPIICQLRPHVADHEFVPRVRRQQHGGYCLARVSDNGAVRAVAGFRYLENLASGRLLYVDDLVTDESQRSKRWGEILFDWLVGQARTNNCDTLELDSGVQRFGAHRFYLRHRMDITSHHFRINLR